MSFDDKSELDQAVEELTEALRLTVEFVGTDMLPPLVGWNWFDALLKYAPAKANALYKSHVETYGPLQ